MTSFQKGMIATAAPVAALGLLSTAGPLTDGALYGGWYFGLLAWLVALVVALGFAIARKTDLASGMFAGVAIGFLALTVTCFANLTTVGMSGVGG